MNRTRTAIGEEALSTGGRSRTVLISHERVGALGGLSVHVRPGGIPRT